MQTIYTSPEPRFLFEYEPTEVECKECHEKFLHTELRSDSMGDDYSDRICPRCGCWDCCDIKFEELED